MVTSTQLSLEKMRVLDGDALDGLRHSYPELDFVFDNLDDLRDTNDDLRHELKSAKERIDDLERAEWTELN